MKNDWAGFETGAEAESVFQEFRTGKTTCGRFCFFFFIVCLVLLRRRSSFEVLTFFLIQEHLGNLVKIKIRHGKELNMKKFNKNIRNLKLSVI